MALAPHVSLLGFFEFWEVFVDVLDSDEWPCIVVAIADGFEPSGVCWKNICCVEVADGWFDAREVIDVVDGFFWIRRLLQEFEHVCDGFGGWDVEIGVEAAASIWAVE